MDAPTPEDLGPLLGETSALDAPAPPEGDSEGAEFDAAAMAAVGTRQKATALRDAFDAYCREKGLLGAETPEEETDEGDDTAEDDDLQY